MLKRIAILFSYVLLAFGIIAATIIIVAFGQGYNYSLRSNSFTINGLLVLASEPSGAKVTLDGKALRRKTPYRNTMQAGLHDVTLSKEGYRDWTKRVQVLATGVTLWQNILLIPNELKPFQVVGGKPATQFFATRDRKRFAYITSGEDTGVWVLSADRKQSQKVYTPAAATADRPAESLLNASWSDDGSHLLVRGQVGSEVNYTVVSSGGDSATNLTQLFKFDLGGLQFSPNDWRELYWISPEGLRKLNVENKTVSAVLVDKVAAFTFAGNDRLVYVQQTASGNILATSDRSGGNAKRLVEAIVPSSAYQLSYSLYRSRDYVTVLPLDTKTATVYGDIFTPNLVAKVITNSAKQIATSDNGRFISYLDDNAVGAYDLDDNLVYTDKMPGITHLSWFDETHFLVNRSGQAELVEFDGGNAVAVLACAGQPYGSNDKKQVLCLAPANGPVADVMAVDLQR